MVLINMVLVVIIGTQYCHQHHHHTIITIILIIIIINININKQFLPLVVNVFNIINMAFYFRR